MTNSSNIENEPVDMVVFGEDWGGLPSSTQHIVGRLAKTRKVVWVNSIGMRRPRVNLRDAKRLLFKGVQILFAEKPNASKAVSNSIDKHAPVVISPMVLPFPGNLIARLVNRRLLGRALRQVCRQQGISNPILWVSLPTAVDAVGELGERAVVYYCGDDFGALDGVDHKPVLALEQELVSVADKILAASPVIAAKFPSAKTVVLPHGVDTTLFSAPTQPAAELPTDKPVAGFYGSISAWLDVALLKQTALRLPHWQFVFIGNATIDVSTLEKLPNVSFLGPRPHSSLPSYSCHWTVSMLPFLDNEQIRACNPLKLREYLAAGRPIVTTEFPALDGYRDLVTVADGPDAFANALKQYETETQSDSCEKRRQRVAGESWDDRAQTVQTILQQL